MSVPPAQVRLRWPGRPAGLAGPAVRPAAVSLWLNSGVPAPQVAEWAGHSVNVLMRVNPKCIDGQEEAVRRRIEAALADPGRNPLIVDPDPSP